MAKYKVVAKKNKTAARARPNKKRRQIKRRFKKPAKRLVWTIVISILLVVFGLIIELVSEKRSTPSLWQRNQLAAQALDNHPVDILVGDSKRVMAIKSDSRIKYQISPLGDCTHLQAAKTSMDMQTEIEKHSFAYLLLADTSPVCNLSDVIGAYGKPNLSTLIAGTNAEPKEQLLFYDHGAHKSQPKQDSKDKAPATVAPITLNELPNTSCSNGTIMNIVAHQDDDLLFINPATLQSIKEGTCIRTVYVTAGDAGRGQFYWLSRELGSEAAYDYMDGPSHDIWISRIVKLATNEFISIDNPRGNSKISLIFMRLPDGNVHGEGFRATNYESLADLEKGKVGAIHSVDGQSVYSSGQFMDSLVALMRTYSPQEIRTQNSVYGPRTFDHSDHIAVGRYVAQARQIYNSHVTIKFYIGYPIFNRPVNVFGEDLTQKENTFLNYAQFDRSVCHNLSQCQVSKASYGAYLPRQYTNPE